VERLQAGDEGVRVEGAERRSEVAQQLDPGLEDEGDVPERLPELEPVVPGVRIGELGELSVVPGKLPPSTMSPPIAWPWPPMYLVAEWTTMFAPCAMGRSSAGVVAVLSTTKGMPASFAIFASSWRWMTSSRGLPSVSA
jgi:hypothetical protein